MNIKIEIDDDQADLILCKQIKDALELLQYEDEKMRKNLIKTHNYFSKPENHIKGKK